MITNPVIVGMLQEPNYLLWGEAVRAYIKAKGKLKHLKEDLPPQGSKSYDEWQ